MTDRELLELAARAAGAAQKIDLSGQPTGIYAHPPEPGILRSNSGGWNPLANDGDALRLAVKLGLDVCIDIPPVLGEPQTQVFGFVADGGDVQAVVRLHGNDTYAATRWAIVKAAALIGRSM